MPLSLYRRYEKWWPLVFFLGGFIYDALSLDRIDSLFGILKHGVYLSVIGAMIALEILFHVRKFVPTGKFATAWRYHPLVIQFFLGSLLSEYTLFFFKSASIWSSFGFLLLLGAILILNEFKEFRGGTGIPIRMALFSICLITYFVYLIPVIQGYVGTVPFILALLAATLVIFVIFKLLKVRVPEERKFLKKQLLTPFAGVVGGFLCLYFTHLIPPIPVAVRYMGIFHDVKKEQGKYLVGYTRPKWKFWQSGDQSFEARPGDRIFCFFRVFSPGRFHDQVKVRWLYDDPKRGWQRSDAIPIPITGGREEGFRGFTYKTAYQPGDWQVRVETTDGRELGRIYFNVSLAEPGAEPPVLTYDMH